MGIPKFFRWMSERYPGLCMTAKEYQLPEIDNFYLDMNGIIHNCSHPCDGDVHFRISEEEMFEDIFNYVETLFKIIKPKKYFFMAVDGVAPRAKMNQQRGRRFRSAKEASERETAAVRKGDILPTEQRFDSNCITPGTTFMIKLNEAMKKFIETKMTTDPSWQNVKVILSGHETPGEGEHKIMDFIRFGRSQQGYDPNTRHCLYGLDTDLIMLGLASHEPHFMLLREEIKFNNKNSKKDVDRGNSQRVDPSKINFHVLYLTLLRDYIERDFMPLKPKLPFKFDLEAIIDDWILICFLVGNDFIPHIPHFHIHKSALPRIFEVYQSTLPQLDGYLNERGFLNLARFKKFANRLSHVDIENYKMLADSKIEVQYSQSNNHDKYKKKLNGFNRAGRYQQNEKHDKFMKSNNPINHSLNHQPNIWYNINRNGLSQADNHQQDTAVLEYKLKTSPNKTANLNGYVTNSSNHLQRQQQQNQQYANNYHSTGKYTNGFINSSQYTPKKRPSYTNGVNNVNNTKESQYGNRNSHYTNGHSKSYNGNSNGQTRAYNGNGKPNGTPAGKIGVHSFTEEQINSSIKVCADGDFMDLSDDEFDSDEKFPGEPPIKNKHQNGNAKKDKLDEQECFKEHKLDYYRTKFRLEPDEETVKNITHEYVRALQWNLHYYYHGCVSWGWFYPFHYAPFISDVWDFMSVNLKFERGQPFKPFEQLLAVLPPASSALLPSIYRNLVMSSNSPLSEYFPAEIEYDLNGKQNEWEAVALAPFIDEKVLLGATTLCNLFLTEKERGQNAHGPHYLYECKLMRVGPSPHQGHNNNGHVGYGDNHHKQRVVAKVKCSKISLDGFHIPTNKIKFGLLKDSSSKLDSDKQNKDVIDCDSFGFPTLSTIEQKFKDAPKFINNNNNRSRSSRIKL